MRCRVSEDLNSYYNDEESNGHRDYGREEDDGYQLYLVKNENNLPEQSIEEVYDTCMDILDLLDNCTFDYNAEEALKLQKTFEKLYQQLLSRTKDE